MVEPMWFSKSTGLTIPSAECRRRRHPRASYRRQFDHMAEQLRYAAETAPEDELMNIMVEHGIGQRHAWNRYKNINL